MEQPQIAPKTRSPRQGAGSPESAALWTIVTNVNCVRKVLKHRDRPRSVRRARLLTDTFPRKATVLFCAGSITVATLAGPAAIVSNASVPTAHSMISAIAPADAKSDFEAAKQQLAAASGAVQAAEDAADAAAAKLPEANNALKRAEAAVADAVAAQGPAEKARADALAVQADAERAHADAEAAVKAAQDAVAKQQAQVTRAQERIDAVKSQIALLARQSYISGSESVELGILLQSQDPAQFADLLQAMARISRGNSTVFKQMTALRAELAAQLVQLNTMKQAAAGREDVAQEKAAEAVSRASDAQDKADAIQALANKAQAARDGAANARAAIVALVDQRKQEVARALALRRQIKATYERLQAKLTKAQGVANTHGTRRDAKAALAWGMKYVGSGASYNGLCLAFVDDAYNPSGGRVGTAIAQWYRAKAAGYGHPGDRNPPVGAQVFWWSGNPARHIALYAGGGMVLTTGAYGGKVGLVTMKHLDGYGPYLGWAEAYYG